jgi:hypothetical protein
MLSVLYARVVYIIVTLSVVMLNVVIQSVIMLRVVATLKQPKKYFRQFVSFTAFMY